MSNLNPHQFGSTGTLKGAHAPDCGYMNPYMSGERELDPANCNHCAILASKRNEARTRAVI